MSGEPVTENSEPRILLRDVRKGDTIVLHNETVTVERTEHAGFRFFLIVFRTPQFPNGCGNLVSGRHYVTLVDRP